MFSCIFDNHLVMESINQTNLYAGFLTSVKHTNGGIRIFDFMHLRHYMTLDEGPDISKALTECITVITEPHSSSMTQSVLTS